MLKWKLWTFSINTENKLRCFFIWHVHNIEKINVNCSLHGHVNTKTMVNIRCILVSYCNMLITVLKQQPKTLCNCVPDIGDSTKLHSSPSYEKQNQFYLFNILLVNKINCFLARTRILKISKVIIQFLIKLICSYYNVTKNNEVKRVLVLLKCTASKWHLSPSTVSNWSIVEKLHPEHGNGDGHMDSDNKTVPANVCVERSPSP